jgi:hypothetical protein
MDRVTTPAPCGSTIHSQGGSGAGAGKALKTLGLKLLLFSAFVAEILR